MKLLDTVVLVGSINPNDKLHYKARNYLSTVVSDEQTFIPAPILIEFELELKSHGFTENERITVFEDLAPLVPKNKVLAQSVTSMSQALSLYQSGMSYFDSLIASMAKESNATVLTTDKAIAKVVKTVW